MNIIKVSANSCTAAVAGAIPGVMREHRLPQHFMEMQQTGIQFLVFRI